MSGSIYIYSPKYGAMSRTEETNCTVFYLCIPSSLEFFSHFSENSLNTIQFQKHQAFAQASRPLHSIIKHVPLILMNTLSSTSLEY